MVTLKKMLFAVIVASTLVGASWAQQVTSDSVDHVKADAHARSAADAARAAAAGQVDTSRSFLTQQSLRAAEITEQARQDPKRAFFLQEQAVQAAKQAHGDWAARELERAGAIGGATIDRAAQAAAIQEAVQKRIRFLVFVSQSMGARELRKAFDLGRGRDDVAYVFRGFKRDQNPREFYEAIRALQNDPTELEKMSTVSLDPPSFRRYGISAVPSIVHVDEESKLIARVDGLVNHEWLRDQVASGERGNLGNRGETFPIAEYDLIEEMKAKAASYDHMGELREASRRYFRELSTIDLPYAQEQRVRHVQPVMTVSQDIHDHEGNRRYTKGQQVSMREELKRAPVLVIFNSQDKYHVEFAKAMAKKAPAGRKVIFMTTRIDREKGIPGYARQEAAIGRPVFLLMPDVQAAFGIERIPTVVTPTDNEFVVVEVPLTQGDSEHARIDPSRR